MTTDFKITCIPHGATALLLQFADKVSNAAFIRCRSITAELERDPPKGLIDFVPAYTTILLEFDLTSISSLENVARSLITQFESMTDIDSPAVSIKQIPVLYNGPDIDRVAQIHKLTRNEVIQLHSAPVYKVYMIGFTPGFPYLGDLDPLLHTPRLSSPRIRVEAGSVAIGGEHTGIYTIESPGGWNVIGHTPLKLFNPTCETEEGMFFLRQGDSVKFTPMAA